MSPQIDQILLDRRNPAQVFACLGIAELAEVLGGPVESRFFQDEATDRPCFQVRWLCEPSASGPSPTERALRFLAHAKVERLVPPRGNWKGTPVGWQSSSTLSDKTEPVRFVSGNHDFIVTSYDDGSSRELLKFFAGKVAAYQNLNVLLAALQENMKKDIQEWLSHLADGRPIDPFERCLVLDKAKRFRMDPRSSWEALGAGYSVDAATDVETEVSPITEILCVIGLENARPAGDSERLYRYALWSAWLPTNLARVAIAGGPAGGPRRTFIFRVLESGKNKDAAYAEEVLTP